MHPASNCTTEEVFMSYPVLASSQPLFQYSVQRHSTCALQVPSTCVTYQFPKITLYLNQFDIHMSVHRKYISKFQPIRCNVSWFIYFYRRSTCFRPFLRPSSGAHNCTYSVRYCQPILLLAASVLAATSSIGWRYLKLYVQLCAPDDGRRNRLKPVERL